VDLLLLIPLVSAIAILGLIMSIIGKVNSLAALLMSVSIIWYDKQSLDALRSSSFEM
tara:strand:- start:586 stop:756 length:171 start_codon:yes stop_codon:yes gene_type:complete